MKYYRVLGRHGAYNQSFFNLPIEQFVDCYLRYQMNNLPREKGTALTEQGHLDNLLIKKCQERAFHYLPTLIARGARVNAVNQQEDSRRETPLHLACFYHDEEAISRLLRAGACLGAVDTRGWTPLHYLCDIAHSEVYVDRPTTHTSLTMLTPQRIDFVERFFNFLQLLLSYETEADPDIMQARSTPVTGSQTPLAIALTGETTADMREELIATALIMTGRLNFFYEFPGYVSRSLGLKASLLHLIDDSLYTVAVLAGQLAYHYEGRYSGSADVSSNALASAFLNPVSRSLGFFINISKSFSDYNLELDLDTPLSI